MDRDTATQGKTSAAVSSCNNGQWESWDTEKVVLLTAGCWACKDECGGSENWANRRPSALHSRMLGALNTEDLNQLDPSGWLPGAEEPQGEMLGK